MSTTDSIVQAESGGNPNATNPNSSATGAGQFINSTWLDTLAKHRPDLTGTPEQLLALRSDPALSKDMTAAYAADNQAHLAKNGVPVTPGTTYLAHFAGPDGAVKVLHADPGASVASVLGPKAVAANPFLQGMTAQGLQAWAAKKMGTAAPVAGVQPAQVAPQQGQPIFAQRPAEAATPPAAPPQQQVATAAQAPPTMPQAPPMAPIFVPQRKPVDLSGLRAALAQRAPIFSNGQG